ncbi:cell filamentation protein Fic [Bacillus pseudomycoides]|uniref:Fic family protein n=1 Tax=Bacillus pseudomycoides TaxID=64104 RepID=UPI000BED2F69|nr:Fic family protein [Bacillus pseudomycoides]PEB42228.1 cell filamentation protein Fic [Bacillus pseudomycoides]PEM69341.1 cell filamentation protein Fic [Bacillus pseudomycoides]PGA62187.1 cell filamentation protein Fic [Bacillus pseudomycoides]
MESKDVIKSLKVNSNDNSFSNEYLSDVLVRLAYNSSAIEGNTISLADTATIILHNTIPSQTNKREFFEIDNHRGAYDYILKSVANKDPLTVGKVKDIHERLTDRLQHDKGQFKTATNYIKGADFKTTPPEQVPFAMQQWVDNLNFRLENAKTIDEKLYAVADQHIQFERIHPFSDGNGRTGRILMNYSLLENNLPPLVIDVKEKGKYINVLAKQDVDGFVEFMKPTLEKEMERIEAFMYKESNQIHYNESNQDVKDNEQNKNDKDEIEHEL